MEDASKSTKWMELELTAILVDTWDNHDDDDDCVAGNDDEDDDPDIVNTRCWQLIYFDSLNIKFWN